MKKTYKKSFSVLIIVFVTLMPMFLFSACTMKKQPKKGFITYKDIQDGRFKYAEEKSKYIINKSRWEEHQSSRNLRTY